MDIIINPGALKGTIQAITSKSELHRILICAAFADQPTNVQVSGSGYDGRHELPKDIQATLSCLKAMGAGFEISDSLIRVLPVRCLPEQESTPVLNCGESGSTFRFLVPVAAASCGKAVFHGSGRLPSRPIAELTEALKAHGVSFSSEKLPFTVEGKPSGCIYEIPGNISSQYLTGLLLMLPLLSENAEIHLTTPLASSGYIDITNQVMAAFGITVQTENGIWKLTEKRAFLSPGTLQAGGDWSNSAAFLTASMLREGNQILCRSLLTNSCQGDRAILELLRSFGAKISCTADGILTTTGVLQGTSVDIDNTPDLLPYLAVAACAASGDSVFYNAGRLRLKESDRIDSTAAMIRALGGSVDTEPERLIVHGSGSLHGGEVDAANDHRIVMAAAIAAPICEHPVIIHGAEAVGKSYPSFFEDFASLKGDCHVL